MIQSEHKRGFTEEEAANYTGMSRSFLRQARMDGEIAERVAGPRFIKIGRSVRYLREDLDNWLDQFEKNSHNAQC